MLNSKNSAIFRHFWRSSYLFLSNNRLTSDIRKSASSPSGGRSWTFRPANPYFRQILRPIFVQFIFFSLKMIQVSDFELNSIILQRKYIFKFKFPNFRPKIVEILAHKKNARSTLYRHFIYCRQQQQQNFSKPNFAFSRSAIFRIFLKFFVKTYSKYLKFCTIKVLFLRENFRKNCSRKTNHKRFSIFRSKLLKKYFRVFIQKDP